ncbi:MAG: 50S ribosomal protein L29 [Kofleriaceae bacterium]
MSKISTSLGQLRDQPDEELRQALVSTRDELFRLHLGAHTNQVTSSALLKTKRRDIARILTVLNGRKQGFEAQQQKTAQTPAEPAAEATETSGQKTKTKKATKKAKS